MALEGTIWGPNAGLSGFAVLFVTLKWSPSLIEDYESCGPPDDGLGRQPLTDSEAAYARELFERHRFALFRYLRRVLASREDASEVLQETYLRLLRQPDFERVNANARAYLFQTAVNLARDRFRQRLKKGAEAEAQAFVAGGLDSPDYGGWPEFALESQQTEALVVAVLEGMEPRMRCALMLNRFRDMTYRQIADCMKVSERTVERYVKEGLRRIARQIEEQR